MKRLLKLVCVNALLFCVNVLLFCVGFGIGTFAFTPWPHTDEPLTCIIVGNK